MIASRTPARALAVVAAATILAAILLTAPALVAGPRNAAHAEPPDAVVQITLEEVAPDFIGPDEDITFTGEVINHGEDSLSRVTVWWRMQTFVPSDDGLTEWLDGDSDVATLTLARHDLDGEIAPGARVPYEMVIPPENSPFDYGSPPGPRGIELVVSAADEAGTTVQSHTRSTLIWYPEDDDATPTRLTVAAPLTATPAEWAESLTEDVPVAQLSGGRIAGALESLRGRGVSWGVDAALLDPAPPAHLERFLPGNDEEILDDDDDPAGAFEWEDPQSINELTETIREAAGTDPVIPLGWASPDYGTLLPAGSSGSELVTKNLTRAAAVLEERGIDQVDGALWALSPVSTRALTHLDDAVRGVIVPPTPGGADVVPPTARHLTARAPDSDVVDLFLHETEPRELLARTALLAQGDRTSVLVTLPLDMDDELAARVADNLDALRDVPWLEVGPLRAPTPDGWLSTRPKAPGALTDQEITTLAESLDRAATLAGLSEHPAQVTGLFEATAFLATSHVWAGSDERPGELLAQVREAASGEFLTIERPSTVNLISQGGELPVSIENNSPLTLTPHVVVRPQDARLQADEVIEAHLEPGQSTTVRLPITAVANGNVPTTIHLVDDTGADVAVSREFVVRVRADWETTGTAVIAGLVGVGFLFGLVRNIRSGARRRAGRNHG